MKAFVCTRYGSPDVLVLREVEKPEPKNNEVLIRIHATTVTAGDVRIRSFTFPFLARLPVRIMFGFTRPRNAILGHEMAGVIESIGKDVKRFKVGDHVFGSTGMGSGTYAQYICLPENGTVATLASGLSHGDSAAVPVGGLTALHFLRRGNISRGQRVLIHGAAGSVGTFAVQLAKYFGAKVTGVCSTRNVDLLESLGADSVVDYTKGEFSKREERFDVIFDAIGKPLPSDYKQSLVSGGRYVSVGRGVAKEKSDDLIFLRELIEGGKIKPVIDRRYGFDEIPEAHRYVEQGHKRGNVVITLA